MSTGDWTHHQHHVRPSPDCHLCPKVVSKSSIELAAQCIMLRFQRFVERIHVAGRESFFHATNADEWVREFAEWLRDEQRESVERGASDD